MGRVMSLQDFRIGNTIFNAPFVEWENYELIFSETDMIQKISNMLILRVYHLLWIFWPSILLTIDFVSNFIFSNKFQIHIFDFT